MRIFILAELGRPDGLPPTHRKRLGIEWPVVQIRELTGEDAAGLRSMYATFEPRGAARGLPPVRAEQADEWLHHLLKHASSLIAIDGYGTVVGHAVVADITAGKAELAVFVHQESRRTGIGKALTRAAIERARAVGYSHLWATASPANHAAIRMVKACGFRMVSQRGAADVELELRLGD